MMGGCDAKLTTCTVTDDVVSHYEADEFIPDGVAVVRDGGRLLRLERHTLTCGHGEDWLCNGYHEASPEPGKWAQWHDDTPGATPATPPADLQTGPNDGLDLEQPPADVCRCTCHAKSEPTHVHSKHCVDNCGTGDRPATVKPKATESDDFKVDRAAATERGTGDRTAVTENVYRAAVEAYMRHDDPPEMPEPGRLLAALEAARQVQGNDDG